MSVVLVTGASGFVGRALAPHLAKNHEVVCMSRKNPENELPWIYGDFSQFEDLRQLDDINVECVVHLAAVIGGCFEREGVMVNVEGTRCLMRYLAERGCQKFVTASSIAAIGIQSPKFRPLMVPVSDEHPCFDRDGYGLSKYLMEEITKYVQRQHEQIDVINLRLSSVFADDSPPERVKIGPIGNWALGSVTMMALSDAVIAFAAAAESEHQPGVRTMNAVCPKSWVADPVADILSNWWGDDVDLSHFAKGGNDYDAVYDPSRIRDELGIVARVLP